MERTPYPTTFDEDVPTDNQTTNGCPECDGPVRTNSRETVCEDCGLVLEANRIDHGPEWRSFDDDDEQPKRTGAPLTPARHDNGLSTRIGRNCDGQGNALDGDRRRRLARLRREHKRAKAGSKMARNQRYGIVQIRRITGALGLDTSLRDRACSLFSSAQEADLLTGRCVEAFAGAAVYVACRCNRTPRSMQELADVSRVSRDRIRNAATVLSRDLGVPIPPAEPDQFVDAIASEVGLPQVVRRHARRCIERLDEAGVVSGCHPVGVAAGCLYYAADREGYPVTQARLGEAADVTSVTIRNHVQSLRHLE